MRGRHTDLARRLHAVRAPGEGQAQIRSWAVVSAAYADRPTPARRRPWRRAALVPALVAVSGALALTPAGAAVHRWIVHTIVVTHVRTALFSLPGPGRVRVAGTPGTWTVAPDGSRHRLGSAPDATWSPHGLYVAVAAGDQLSALTPAGVTVWSVARPDVRAPRWFGPDGYRIAYLSADSLRVIAGDGTGDHELDPRVGDVAPAWRPGTKYALT